MIIWIQRHDFSYEELNINSSEEAVNAFENFDWKTELLNLEESEEEVCPPGFGIVADDGHILHLCPKESGECLTHFHYPKKERILFFFKRKTLGTITRENFPWDNGILLIRRMFLGDLGEIIEMI